MEEIEFTIGHLSRETGCKIPTIRYYENIGLMPKPPRSTGNTRVYEHSHLQRLDFIQHCRELGFNQNAIRELLDLTDRPDQSCAAVTEIAQTHLETVNQRISRLTALKSELKHMITACEGGRIEQCRIIERLADHSHTTSRTQAK
ncbi:MAG: helix-turn-helix domain-containing protein [Paracoccaceae bacterium]|nr:helix-turn-helix domain-containing protein [Paracoccaceae bacterium]